MSTIVEISQTEETVNSLVDESLPPVDDAADLSDDESDETEPDGQVNEYLAEVPAEPDDTEPAEAEPEPASPRLEALLAEIAEAEMLCANAEEAVDEAKGVLKETKAEYDGCVMRLRRLAKAVRKDEDRPLFDRMETEGSSGAADTGPAVDVDDDADADAYTECLTHSIESLGLQPGVVAKLTEEGIRSVGDLEKLREEITLGRKEWPKGIGVAKQSAIEDAIIDYVRDHATPIELEVEVEEDEEDEENEEVNSADTVDATDGDQAKW